jgi:hypothetical protein
MAVGAAAVRRNVGPSINVTVLVAAGTMREQVNH